MQEIEKYKDGAIYEETRGEHKFYSFKSPSKSTGVFKSLDVLKKAIGFKSFKDNVKTQTPKNTRTKKVEVKNEPEQSE